MNAKTNNGGNLFPGLLSDFFDNNKLLRNPWFENEFSQSIPPVNIKENEKEFEVDFAAPGFSKSDFKIEADESLITVSAEKKTESKEEKDNYTRKEFSYNSFSRSFTLPLSVNSEKIDAKYNDGILKLFIPKKELAKTNNKKEIKVA